MKTFIPLLILFLVVFAGNTLTINPMKTFEKDSFETEKGKLEITFIGHASLMIQAGNQVNLSTGVLFYFRFFLLLSD